MPRARTLAPPARLESWKAIAAYLGRSVRTVQRWEREEGLPVHRQRHHTSATVFARLRDLETWRDRRSTVAGGPRRLRLLVLPPAASRGQDLGRTWTEELMARLGAARPDRLEVIGDFSASGGTPGATAWNPNCEYRLAIELDETGAAQHLRARLLKGRRQCLRGAASFAGPPDGGLRLEWIDELVTAVLSWLAWVPPADSYESLAASLDPAAQEAYLQGRFLAHGSATEQIYASREKFAAAVAREPRWAAAQAALADSQAVLAMAPHDRLPPLVAMPQAEAAARMALRLDPNLAEAHAAWGLVLHHFRWRWAAAERAYRRAIELDPLASAARLRCAWLLIAQSRHAEAMGMIAAAEEIARRRDPLRLAVLRASAALAHFYRRDYAAAAAECRRGLELQTDLRPLRWLLARALAAGGDVAEAGRVLPAATATASPMEITARGVLAARAGDLASARQAERRLEQLRQVGGYVPATYCASLAVAQGAYHRAFAWLDRALAERTDGLVWLGIDPIWDPLRAERHFGRLHAAIFAARL